VIHLLDSMHSAVVAVSYSISPDGGGPGAHGLQRLINVLAFYALLATAGGFLLGVSAWAVGSRIGNDYVGQSGKMGIVVALGAAFLLGGAATFLNFAYDLA